MQKLAEEVRQLTAQTVSGIAAAKVNGIAGATVSRIAEATVSGIVETLISGIAGETVSGTVCEPVETEFRRIVRSLLKTEKLHRSVWSCHLVSVSDEASNFWCAAGKRRWPGSRSERIFAA